MQIGKNARLSAQFPIVFIHFCPCHVRVVLAKAPVERMGDVEEFVNNRFRLLLFILPVEFLRDEFNGVKRRLVYSKLNDFGHRVDACDYSAGLGSLALETNDTVFHNMFEIKLANDFNRFRCPFGRGGVFHTLNKDGCQ